MSSASKRAWSDSVQTDRQPQFPTSPTTTGATTDVSTAAAPPVHQSLTSSTDATCESGGGERKKHAARPADHRAELQLLRFPLPAHLPRTPLLTRLETLVNAPRPHTLAQCLELRRYYDRYVPTVLSCSALVLRELFEFHGVSLAEQTLRDANVDTLLFGSEQQKRTLQFALWHCYLAECESVVVDERLLALAVSQSRRRPRALVDHFAEWDAKVRAVDAYVRHHFGVTHLVRDALLPHARQHGLLPLFGAPPPAPPPPSDEYFAQQLDEPLDYIERDCVGVVWDLTSILRMGPVYASHLQRSLCCQHAQQHRTDPDRDEVPVYVRRNVWVWDDVTMCTSCWGDLEKRLLSA